MNRLFPRQRLVLGAAIITVLAACEAGPSVIAPERERATAPEGPSQVMAAATSGTVRMEAHFTDLRGGATQDMSILNHVIYLIDNAPAGSTIRTAIHNISANVVQAALQRAKDRGVTIYVVMSGNHHPGDPADDGDTSPEDLQAYLDGGSGARFRWCVNGGSYTGAGWDGCIARRESAIMHSKLFLFSRTRDAAGVLRDNVSWFGSANPTYATGANSYNNTVTVYGDKTLYDNFVTKYWAPLWAKTSYASNDFYDSGSGRGYFGGSTFNLQVYASPEQQTDIVYNRLTYVEPDTACAIRVAEAMFNDTRNNVAQLLVAKKRAGCWVSVAVGSIGSQSLATLRGAGITVQRINTHDKFILVKGRYAGSTTTRRIVFTGSHNLSHSANYLNDELFVKLEDDTIYASFRYSWERMTQDEDVYTYP
jgi:phosphatidylserine/phosphatidylglycerophosphate/cardiolipin synthase-like enzyme